MSVGTTPLALSHDSPPAVAIRESIVNQWNEHGTDIAKWKTPAALYAEHEHLMGPYGASDSNKKNRHRSNYNRQTIQHFKLNGKSA